jgi:hypothetical protein
VIATIWCARGAARFIDPRVTRMWEGRELAARHTMPRMDRHTPTVAEVVTRAVEMTRAVRSQWHGRPPEVVQRWLAGR